MKIIERIGKLINEINSNEEITENSDLKLDLGLDSLSLVTLIVRMEETFEIMFDDSDLDPSKITTVGALVKLVEKSL